VSTLAQSHAAAPDLDSANADLQGMDAPQIVRWAADHFGAGLVMTTSFGAQAAVMLHLVTRELPRIPVVFIDTGFHFQETYQFADDLTRRLDLNLKVYHPQLSPAWMVARHGKLWDKGDSDAEKLANSKLYDTMRKVEPMQRALRELGVTAWLAGLRGRQTDHRAGLRHVEQQDGIYKVHPILTWSTRDIHEYIKRHDLPYHPLHDQGYVSIGDWHSTRPITAGEDERAGRFAGLKQECGLHLPATAEENASRESSGL
jgi:phosphoadenosine phosphosulfate reductase